LSVASMRDGASTIWRYAFRSKKHSRAAPLA
jgi:hypothetical protein